MFSYNNSIIIIIKGIKEENARNINTFFNVIHLRTIEGPRYMPPIYAPYICSLYVVIYISNLSIEKIYLTFEIKTAREKEVDDILT